MESHNIPTNPFEDPFASSEQVTPRPRDENYLSRVIAVCWLLATVLLVGLVLTTPLRAEPSPAPKPRPIMSVCQPPSCTVTFVTPEPTSTPEPTATSTPTATPYSRPWLNDACLLTMQRIMQYELNGSTDLQAYRFLATQLLWRANSNRACDFDGQWTGYNNNIQPITSAGLNAALADLPTMQWPYCQLVGSFSDVRLWLSKKLIDRTKTIIGFYADPYGNIFGVNCTPG